MNFTKNKDMINDVQAFIGKHQKEILIGSRVSVYAQNDTVMKGNNKIGF